MGGRRALGGMRGLAGGLPRLAAVRIGAAQLLVEGDRPRPAVVRRDEALLQPMEGRRSRLDAEALRDHAPALAAVGLPHVDDVAAGPADDLRDRAGVVHVARGPATVQQQVGDQVTRRAVVAHHLVDERVAVAGAVAVHVAEPRVHPDVAAAGIPVEGDVLRGRVAGGQGKGKREGRQEAVALHARLLGGCRRSGGGPVSAIRVNAP